MFILGLTGGIATGKSTVSRFFGELGIPIIDADVIAREVVKPGTYGYKRVVAKFHNIDGEKILLQDGSIDRTKLGSIIFANPEKRKVLNSILHPLIKARMLWKTLKLYVSATPMVILDVPLLFESSLDFYTSASAVVYCPESVQETRLMERDGCDLSVARQRMASQLGIEVKKERADYVIDNSRDLDTTKKQVHELVEKIRPSYFRNMLYLFTPFFILSAGLYAFYLKSR